MTVSSLARKIEFCKFREHFSFNNQYELLNFECIEFFFFKELYHLNLW